MAATYVILLPHGQGNEGDKHLVVTTDEYVRVVTGEAEKYTEVYEHTSYDEAAIHRTKLNTPKPVLKIVKNEEKNAA